MVVSFTPVGAAWEMILFKPRNVLMSKDLPAPEPPQSFSRSWIPFFSNGILLSSARLQVGTGLSLSRTRPDADISVVEKVATVLGIATENEERDADNEEKG